MLLPHSLHFECSASVYFLLNHHQLQTTQFASSTPLQNSKVLFEVWIVTPFAVKHCTVFVCSFVMCNSSKYWTCCLSYVGDYLVDIASIIVYDICVKNLETFAFVLKVLRHFFADYYIVLFKNKFNLFLKSQRAIT